MTYDGARGRVVLFGGSGIGVPSDTWEYDGTWTKRVTAASPPPRNDAVMTYNAGTGRVVLFGGFSNRYFDDFWEFDGVSWTEQIPIARPSARSLSGIAYDAVLDRIVLFGGYNSSVGVAGDTWTLGFTPLLAGEACSSDLDYDRDGKIGCADDECWGRCTPLCPPTGPAVCPTSPACGDAVCAEVEDCRSCPADCAAGSATCAIICGDFYCDGPETVASCPGDCT